MPFVCAPRTQIFCLEGQQIGNVAVVTMGSGNDPKQMNTNSDLSI